ncbi:hypothetical protein IEQ34_000798 [Dendrobium chrysotoxum]|uniref:Uncharacterized protein n=1 Tax=Dendrobium chrysotoxum TaxID=161865 RepID=A0AAV7HA13_DENCH|nr:hypothetical protein IEQ34_000798 [Dendrobium chrysotoxum]
MINLLELVEECGVDVSLKFSLGLSSSKVECKKWVRESKVECKKWVRETNETVIVKKSKIEEGQMPYYLHIMPTVIIGPKGYCYANMMPCWVPISMEVIGNNLYEPRDNPSLALETGEVAAI